MPIYDYKCSKCGKTTLDQFQKMNDPAPICCNESMHKLIGMPSIEVFHSGWYEHLAPEPMYFDSKKKIKNYCKEHNLTMPYLE